MIENENEEMKRTPVFSILAVPIIAIYLFPIFTMTSLYTKTYFPYLLFGLFVLAGWFGQWIRLRLTSFVEKNKFSQIMTAVVAGILFAMVPGLLLTLSIPEIMTIGAGGCIATYISLNFDPIMRTMSLWRLQITGTISAIVLTIVPAQIEFMQSMEVYSFYIYAAGAISFWFWIVGQYRAQLDRAVLNDGKRRLVLKQFTRANHQRITWMLIIIAGIGAFPSLAAWLAPLRDRLLAWIRGLFNVSSPVEPPPTPEMPNEPMSLPDELRGEPSEPSVLWDILSWIVFGAAVALILWLLIKLGRTVMDKLTERFKDMLRPVQKKQEPKSEYVDISETLEVPTKVRKRWFRKKEPVPAQAADRIRYYYRTWVSLAMERGSQIEKSDTPLEVAETIKKGLEKHGKLAEAELARILPVAYNAVRYGEKVDDDPDVLEMDRIWKSYRK